MKAKSVGVGCYFFTPTVKKQLLKQKLLLTKNEDYELGAVTELQ